MRVHLQTEATVPASERKLLERRVARLHRRLGREAGDHVVLTIRIGTEPRTGRSSGVGRLAIGQEMLLAQRDAGEAPSSLLTGMFDDLERQVCARSARRRARRRVAVV